MSRLMQRTYRLSQDCGVSCTLSSFVFCSCCFVVRTSLVNGVGYVYIGYCPGLVVCFVLSIWCGSFLVLSTSIYYYLFVCLFCGSPFVFSRLCFGRSDICEGGP